MVSLHTPVMICVVGKMGAGKDTVGDLLAEELQVPLLGVSTVLRELAQAAGKTLQTRDEYVAFSNLPNIDNQVGEVLLARLTPMGIVTGIRMPSTYVWLKEHAQTVLVWVEADDEVRISRIIARRRAGDPNNITSMLEFERREYAPGGKLDIDGLKTFRDFTIDNSADMETLHTSIRLCTTWIRDYLSHGN